jgi:glycosyltransferase involved in cell wall biosynthesis
MERILAFVPMYNCANQIGRVLAQFDGSACSYLSELLVVDNRSTDGSVDAAFKGLGALKGVRARLVQNDDNYGLGGSHKVAFDYALKNRFDYCVILHGDDQGSIADITPLIAQGAHRQVDCLLGARFMTGSQLDGYSQLRTWANRGFNLLYSAAAGKRLFDLGAGLNLYATAPLRGGFYLRLADDLTFNYTLILATVAKGWRIRFFPLTWRETDQISNARLLRQAFKTLGIVSQFAANRSAFLAADHSTGRRAYTWRLLYDSADQGGGTTG